MGGVHYFDNSTLRSVPGSDHTIIVPPSAGNLARRDDSLLGEPTCSGGDYWWEVLSSTEVFDMCGTWRASMDDPPRIAGTIDGAFGYYKGVGPHWTTDLFCRAHDHQFTLDKR